MNAGQLYEKFAQAAFENIKIKADARDQDAMFNFLKNQHERQRKAEMDKVCWLPGTKAGERFRGEAEYAEFSELNKPILL